MELLQLEGEQVDLEEVRFSDKLYRESRGTLEDLKGEMDQINE